MAKIYALCLSFFALAVLFFSNTPQSFAANCSSLFNGGITNQQYCINPTPTPTSNSGSLSQTQVTPLPANQPQTTKGGLPIYPAAKSKKTPNTGPEDWSLPALFLIGGMGFFLRNKAKTDLKT
jgi:hypothetical protein